jgi:hypothetical protein
MGESAAILGESADVLGESAAVLGERKPPWWRLPPSDDAACRRKP